MRRVQKMIAFILWSIPFLAVALAFYFLATKWPLTIRLAIAITIWLLPTAILTAWVVRTGDKAAPDAITVNPQSLEHSSDNKNESK
jgi:hypothetical protein